MGKVKSKVISKIKGKVSPKVIDGHVISPTLILDKLNIVHAIYELLVNDEYRCYHNVFLNSYWREPVELTIDGYGKMDFFNRFSKFESEVDKLKRQLAQENLL